MLWWDHDHFYGWWFARSFVIDANLTTCDDESDPLLQDGIFSFDTSTFQNTILGVQTRMAVSYYDANGAFTKPTS
jgi:hypothetical protein